MKHFMEIFGENLRLVRQSRGFSQENVAEQLGMSASGYAKIERGETDIPLSRLEELAKVFDMTVPQLISLTDKSNVFNIKYNRASPIINTNSNHSFQQDNQELTELLKKSLEALTLLVNLK
jgi:transcriptional regulator with XRE-family HTH domain